MDSISPRVKTRNRTKSSTGSTSGNNIDSSSDAMANLNGEKDVPEKEKSESTSNISKDSASIMESKEDKSGSSVVADNEQSVEPKSDRVVKGRKRKASEMKSDDSATEEPPTKEKPPFEVEESGDITNEAKVQGREAKGDMETKSDDQLTSKSDDKDKGNIIFIIYMF